MKTSEILRRAKARIDKPQKWCKGEYDSRTGRHCAVGALGGLSNRLGPARKALLRSMKRPGLWVSGFNDAPSTKHTDIMALYDRAIAEREAAGD